MVYIKYKKDTKEIVAIKPEPFKKIEEGYAVIEVSNIQKDDYFKLEIRTYNGEDKVIKLNKQELAKKQEINLVKQKIEKIKKLNLDTKAYITQKLKGQDWGNTYEECLSELQNTAISTETKILYFLKPKIPNLTLTQIRENIALYIARHKTKDQIIQELTQAGLTQEEIDQYFDLLKSAVEVAKLINWIEQVWEYVEQKEEEIQNTTTIEQLEQIINNIQFPSIE